MAEAVGVSQSAVSRCLRELERLGITEKVGRAYVVGPKAGKYLDGWGVSEL